MHDWLRRLEPLPPYGDLDRGIAQEVADPLWMLARQWQLGEHHGEDAGVPVGVTIPVAHVPVEPLDGLDPTMIPAEAILEGSAEDWWTPGRRVRVGRAVAPDLSPGQQAAARFAEPLPPPYGEAFAGEIDGRAAWRRNWLAAGHPALAGFRPDIRDRWRTGALDHQANFSVGQSTLRVRGHGGGDVDWHSCDGGPPLPPPDAATPSPREIVPLRLRYPGAPLPRIWQIEDPNHDLGGYPPDRAHLATALLIQLTGDHADDWFLVPVPPPAPDADTPAAPGVGVVVTLGRVKVRSSFDEVHDLLIPPGRGDPPAGPDEPAGPWSLYRTRGLDRASLVVFPTAASPLIGPALDDVILGADENADLVWAVELLADGLPLAADAESAAALRDGRRTGSRDFAWMPSSTLPEHWHPYRVETRDGGARRMFVQGRVADLGVVPPAMRPGPRSELIGGSGDADRQRAGAVEGRGHELAVTAVPYQGLRLERRYLLARGVDGRPVLWRQRRRVPLLGPPVSHLRFDVMREALAPEG